MKPNERFQLTIHKAQILQGEPEVREHTELHWVTLAELNAYEMPPADRPVIEAFAAESQGAD